MSIPLTVGFVTLLLCVVGVLLYKRYVSSTSWCFIQHRASKIFIILVLFKKFGFCNSPGCADKLVVQVSVLWEFLRTASVWILQKRRYPKDMDSILNSILVLMSNFIKCLYIIKHCKISFLSGTWTFDWTAIKNSV